MDQSNRHVQMSQQLDQPNNSNHMDQSNGSDGRDSPDPPEIKLDSHLRFHLWEHPTDMSNLMISIRLTVKQPPANWSHLKWEYPRERDGHTIWYLTIPQSQILSLAQCPEVAAMGLGGKIGPL